ncbi:MAG: UDP-N-acetylenolpyruvoylglucosamine reductase [Gammaproteobacteria bacterium (ex Lamellibrachia satsuma)]|nr:MAG: UDP-N-acetylmuramate dehydrogenase [Gammaproteobacteria bacterium (ex Lamellibrachia satsuma)]RRS30648.1 MAG: UDP-N-acetylenolpyruvoylglucosamine reductase [Gammaproteobacteria bacterium (ex Lamellibrachia satsuma)]RRS37534.1 MAG: UDP-N-acetylenolpyruvoylglucosamine reductase [Gammaproteobacteria bacterium (ex Lamellibrachia satsuma)]
MPALDEKSLRGELLFNEPLSGHTTWRVGGPARRFYRPADSADLVQFLLQLEADEPLLWLGLGSNLLVRDGGFPGTVIATQGRLNRLEWQDGTRLNAEAGVSCAKVARTAARAGLCGVEFLAGIPGTLGGALAMNAGAFGGEVWDQVKQVETLDRYGEVRKRTPDDFDIGYRSVKGTAGEWFLSAELQLQSGDVNASQQVIRTLLERRAATQPTSLPSCGSVFRNPTGNHAAKLIESAGLKGTRIGGAQVSEKHANFIINTGDATAADIEALINKVQSEVELHSGVLLLPEVHRVGEAR